MAGGQLSALNGIVQGGGFGASTGGGGIFGSRQAAQQGAAQPNLGPMQGFSPQAMSGLARLMGQGPGVQRNTFQPKTYQPQYQANFTQAIQRQQAAMNPVLAALYGGGGAAAFNGASGGSPNSLSGQVNPGFSGTQPAAPVFDGAGNMISMGAAPFGNGSYQGYTTGSDSNYSGGGDAAMSSFFSGYGTGNGDGSGGSGD